MTLTSNKISSNNRLVKVYRWFKRRQFAIGFKAGKALKEHDETRHHGAPFKWCPTARMAIIWGPFLIFPFWVARFIVFPTAMALLAFTLFGGVGMMILTETGLMQLPTTFFGSVIGMFLGLLFIAVSFVAFIFFIFLITKVFESVSDGLRSLRKQQTKKAEAEVRAVPIISAWLKGIHDKLCPTGTIVVEAEA